MRPPVLVNAAGGNNPSVTVVGDHKFEHIQQADWAASFDLNLVGGAVIPCQVFGPGMVKRKKGRSSTSPRFHRISRLSRVVAYSAAKAAVVSLTKFLAREWATAGVRVNTLTPGFFPAEQNRVCSIMKMAAPTERAHKSLATLPWIRFGNSDELIGAAVFFSFRPSLHLCHRY